MFVKTHRAMSCNSIALVGVKKQGISEIRSYYTSLDSFIYYSQYCFIIEELKYDTICKC